MSISTNEHKEHTTLGHTEKSVIAYHSFVNLGHLGMFGELGPAPSLVVVVRLEHNIININSLVIWLSTILAFYFSTFFAVIVVSLILLLLWVLLLCILCLNFCT